MDITLLHSIASGLLILWGVAHLFATKSVMGSVGDLSEDGGKITLGLWIVEGLALIFIGAQMITLILVFGGDSYTVLWVARISFVMIILLVVNSLFTSARAAILPMKLCPVIKFIAALLYLAGILLF